MLKNRINASSEQLAQFCRNMGIRKLSFFGSVTRDDYRNNSDIDVLVEFEPGVRVGYIRLSAIERVLGQLLGRKVDLNTPGTLSGYFRQAVLAEAKVYYDAT